MKDKNSFDRRALLSLGTVTILAPMLRLFPASSVETAGRAAWLSAAVALPVTAAYIFFLSALMKLRKDGEQLQDLALRILGQKLGRAFLLLSSAWLILYAGFELRSGSERLIVTVYPDSMPGAFSAVMAVLVLSAVLSSERTIVRAARIISPVVLGAFFIVILFSLSEVKADNLLPVCSADILPLFLSSFAAVDIVSVGAYSMCFFEGCTPNSGHRKRDFLAWAAAALLLMTLLNLAIIGSFGAEITGILSRPFFVLVRNLVFFRSVERVEALVVMLWLFPDFLQVSLLLYAAQYSLRLFAKKDAAYKSNKLLDMSEGRYMIWLCCLASLIIALTIAPDSVSMKLWSQRIIPIINLSYAFIVLPLVYIAGRRRGAKNE